MIVDRMSLRQRFGKPDFAAVAVALAFGLTALGGIELTRQSGRVAMIWPANAILLAAILRLPARAWPRYLIAAFMANVLADIAARDSWTTAALLSTANSFEVVVAALLLRSREPADLDISRVATFFRFILAAGIAAPLASGVIASSVLASQGANFADVWRTWSLADGLGMIVLCPPALMLRTRQVAELFERRRITRTVTVLGLVLAVTACAFAQDRYPLVFTVLSILVLASFQLSFAGAALATLLAAAIAIGMSLSGHGPAMLNLASLVGFRVFVLQAFLAVSVATTLPIAAALRQRDELLVNEHRRAEEERTYSRQLRALHLIASNASGYHRDQINAALDLCREALVLDWAYFGVFDIDRGLLTVENSVGSERHRVLPAGERVPLEKTAIGSLMGPAQALAPDQLLCVNDLRTLERGAEGLAQHDEFGAYIAVPIYLSDRAYGCIGFVGRKARPTGFSATNREFVQITGALISAALERGLHRDRLDMLAFSDYLTGLPNRMLFHHKISQLLEDARYAEERFALLYLDLDGFKEVNDRYGHAAGDLVLKATATRIKECFRKNDIVARIGGDEFVVVLPSVGDPTDATKLAATLVEAVALPIEDTGAIYEVSASVGVSLYPDDGTTADALLHRADKALYQAKASGKNVVVRADQLAA